MIKNKQSIITFLLTVLMSVVGENIFAHDIAVANTDGKTIYYVWTNNNTELAVSYQGSSYYKYSDEYTGSVVIPSSVVYQGNIYSVTSIGNYAFRNCSGLKSITIPNSAVYIDDCAFQGCSSLNSVTIPNSVTSIGYRTFAYCSGLTSVTIGNNVTYIGLEAFAHCSALTSINIPNSVTKIRDNAFSDTGWYKNQAKGLLYLDKFLIGYKGDKPVGELKIVEGTKGIADYAFYVCSGLTSVTVPKSVTSIGYHAFAYCSGLTSVTIPSSVTTIGESAFRNCTSLTSVTIPNSVTNIDRETFRECTSLTSVTIPNGVTSISGYAFYGCSGLTSVTIPNSVVSIGGDAFKGCSDLTSVTIPNSVTSIGYQAFYGCSGLTSITIPNSVTSIGEGAFLGTGWYENQVNGLLYLDRWLLGYKGDKPIGELGIAEGTKGIAGSAFSSCSGLTSVIIPNSVTTIEESVFKYCSGLTSITIPNSVTSIGYLAFFSTGWYENQPNGLLYLDRWLLGYKGDKPVGELRIAEGTKGIAGSAFSSCSGLTSVTIPNSVTNIVYEAFAWCSALSSVTIGKGVTTIGPRAFTVCETLICNATTPPTCGEYALTNIDKKTCKLYVPKGCLTIYENAEQWKDFFFMEEGVGTLLQAIIGDANGDGKVNAADIVEMVNAKNGKSSAYFNLQNADMDGNSVINQADIDDVVNIIMSQE